jgi:hypothetical protein
VGDELIDDDQPAASTWETALGAKVRARVCLTPAGRVGDAVADHVPSCPDLSGAVASWPDKIDAGDMHEERTTNVVGSSTCSWRSGRPSMESSSISVATHPISTHGCRTVVKGGELLAEKK